MKSMRPPLAAIFFMINFYRAGGGGGMASSAPLDPLLVKYMSGAIATLLPTIYAVSKGIFLVRNASLCFLFSMETTRSKMFQVMFIS